MELNELPMAYRILSIQGLCFSLRTLRETNLSSYKPFIMIFHSYSASIARHTISATVFSGSRTPSFVQSMIIQSFFPLAISKKVCWAHRR